MLSVLKSTALHGIKWHFSALTVDSHCFSALIFDARQNSCDHFGISWQKRPFPLDFAVNFFNAVEMEQAEVFQAQSKPGLGKMHLGQARAKPRLTWRAFVLFIYVVNMFDLLTRHLHFTF